MTIKEFIKLFVPPIIVKIKDKLVRKKNVELMSSPLPQIEHHSEKMVIIGNGPSLNQSVEKYKDIIKSNDCIAVNYFALTSLYENLKPSFYALADPAFFSEDSEFRLSVQELSNKLFENTVWSMSLIVPRSSLNSRFIHKIRANNNITILPYNNIFSLPSNTNLYDAWDKNLVAPPAQTVLNLCVYVSLYWGYKETYLIGADTSFLTNLRIDQSNNKLYSIESHFYNNDDIYKDDDLFDETKKHFLNDPIWYELQCIAKAFKAYSELQDYADYKHLKVYNASEYSWIDAFERKKLK